ncbi:SARP family transcriptional regulator [Rhizocola hellebori]|uniref:SARP family transcriptional regulator n=1 Tax=Rhizocola hellebori TaxID=1392758 RepID=A0A8J3VGM7_9ACTN|nr:SARP family transcriptional regulator [Rhizocola hellebori]
MGPLEVWAGDERVDVGGPKHRRVLAALAMEPGRVLSIEELVDAVWEEEPPETARRQVQNAVSALRQTPIAAVLMADGPGYLLRIEPRAVDVGRFEEHVAQAARLRRAGDLVGAVEALQAGLALWRGPALAGVGGHTAALAVTKLEEKRLAAVVEWASAKLDLGHHDELVDELTALAGRYRYAEPLTGLLMLALHRCGRRADALTRYRHFGEVLRVELRVTPGSELHRLSEQIADGDPALDYQPPAQVARNDLPRDVATFTGRGDELALLSAMVDEANTVVIHAIDGMAGVGKTALAVHAAHQLTERFRDGQLFVDLHGFTPGHSPLAPGAALDILLRAAGVPDEEIAKDVDEKASQWRAKLAGRRTLVVLDNAADTAQVRPLLPGSSGCLVLITSRRRLVDLDGVRTLSLDVLSEADAIALFTRSAGPQRTDGDPAGVAEVVRLCGYLPLAIGIVAARLRHRPMWTLAHLAERLGDEHRRLALLDGDDQGVAAAFALSHRHLSPGQQRLFRLMGLHPGGDIDVYAAADLAGLPFLETERLLEDLVDAHLLLQQSLDRYRFHDLLRDYAAATVAADEPEQARADATIRLLDHYLGASIGAVRLLSQGFESSRLPVVRTDFAHIRDAQRARRWLETEVPNLLEVAAFAADGASPEHAQHLSDTLGGYLDRAGRLREALGLHTIALRASERLDDVAEAVARLGLGMAQGSLGDFTGGSEQIAMALKLFADSGDLQGECSSANVLAVLNAKSSRFDEALRYFNKALVASQKLGHVAREAVIRNNLGRVAEELGRHDEALVHYTEAHELSERSGNIDGLVLALGNIGVSYGRRHEHEKAITYLEKALTISRDNGFSASEARNLDNIGICLRELGRPAEALALHEQALQIQQDINDAYSQAFTWNNISAVHLRLARHEAARDAAQRSLDIVAELGLPSLAGEAHVHVGLAQLGLGDTQAALATLTTALELCMGRDDEGPALDGLGAAYLALGQAEQAAAHWRRAAAVFTEQGDPRAAEVTARLAALAA